jgi:two-component system, OmpR family, response regulator ChvI
MKFLPSSTSSFSIIIRSNVTIDHQKTKYTSQFFNLPSNLPNRDLYSNRIAVTSDSSTKKSDQRSFPMGEFRASSQPINIHSTIGNKRILIVDDDEDISRFFELALERGGFITEVFNNPQSALTNFKKETYDLLLLDINMPRMNGFELYKKLKQIDSDVKVCFITAYEEYYSEFKKEFPNLDELECYIKKPIGMDYLINVVKSRLN